jgi:phenylacetic acid degradation operon negative regulatory protein
MYPPSPGPLPGPLKAVLRHFRAQRPLRGGSLLVTIFGDAIAPRGGIVTLGSLIRLAAPFGLTERLVRTAAARLARDGWLAAERSGRHSEYRLSRAGAERFAEATLRIYAPAPQTWDRGWTLLMLPAGRPRPAELREGLKWLGFGQLSAAVFAHPGTTPEEARRWLLKMPGAADALLLHARGVDALSERRLAAQGWDLAELGRRYQRFLGRFQPLVPIVHARGLSGECAFLVRTLLIHEYRKIHLQDPLLPPTLLPAHWVGGRAYELTRRLYAAVIGAAELYLSESARRLDGPLPAATPGLQQRFGGTKKLRA